MQLDTDTPKRAYGEGRMEDAKILLLEEKNMKLFRAYSIVDGFNGHDEVALDWFRADREHPVAPYEELIADYESLDNSECHTRNS